MRVYISGPMSGLPEFNYPAFFAADAALTEAGYTPINPARHPSDPAMAWVDYMRLAVRDVSEADGIALLPDWPLSRGARLEHAIGKHLELDIRDLGGWLA